MWFIQGFVSLVGRLMLCAIFLMAVLAEQIPSFDATVKTMGEQGIPMPRIALIGAILFLIVGSLLIIVGFKARVGALLLLIFLALATYYFHDFWHLETGSEAQKTELAHFMKNLALGGAMVLILANGAGRWALDTRRDDDDDDFLNLIGSSSLA